MFRRVFLLIATNFAIMMMLSLVLSGLQAAGVLPEGQWGVLLVYAAVFGFGGSFVSLLISKQAAKWSTGAKVIGTPRSETEAWLMETVARQAERLGIKMPEVAVYDSPDPNAFATGPTRNSSLVAVSTGLLRVMDRRQVEAVLGHEMAHVANGDMVTLTLLQGVLNTFVFFLARVIGTVVDSALSRGDEERRGPGIGYMLATLAAQVVLGIGASMVVAWFSRRREYRADAGGAELTNSAQMASALRALARVEGPADLPKNLAAFGAHNGGLMGLMSSHPPIAERIARLEARQPGAAEAVTA